MLVNNRLNCESIVLFLREAILTRVCASFLACRGIRSHVMTKHIFVEMAMTGALEVAAEGLI